MVSFIGNLLTNCIYPAFYKAKPFATRTVICFPFWWFCRILVGGKHHQMKTRALCAILIFVGAALFAQSESQILKELQRRIGPGTGVTISVQNGAVTLSGTTTSLAQKLSIINTVRRTIGVTSVVDRANVVPAVKWPDAKISEAVRQALALNLSKDERNAITVRVQNGVVTLTGTLPSSYPKQVVGVLASLVTGVVEVRNEIVVRPTQTRSDTEILADVITLFSKNPIIPSKQIAVTVSNGVVTLSGVVSTFVQADQAESSARFVPGVIDVRNLLYVRS